MLPLKKLFYFFSCFLFLEVVRLPVRTSIAVPWVRVSNAFYASLRLLKAGNSGGLPSLSLLVFRYFYVRESPVWTLFGAFLAIYWSCKLAQVGEGKPSSFVGLPPSPDRAKLHAHSAVSLSSFTRLPFIVSRDLTNSLAQWEVISENVLPH